VRDAAGRLRGCGDSRTFASVTPGESAVEPESLLSEAQCALGRRLAWSSHSAAMTHRFVFTQDLPTLALISLGASETVLGIQRSLERFAQVLQLRRFARWASRANARS